MMLPLSKPRPMSNGNYLTRVLTNSVLSLTVADSEARMAVAFDHFSTWRTCEDMLDKKKQYACMVMKFNDFLCEVHDRSFQLKPRAREVTAQPGFAALWELHGAFGKFEDV